MFRYATLVMLIILIPLKLWAAAEDDEHQRLKGGSKGAHAAYQAVGSSSKALVDPGDDDAPEDFSAAHNPIISHSGLVKRYIECTTICCFLSTDWLHFAAFMSGLAACTLSGFNIAATDPYMRSTLATAIFIVTTATTVFIKLENFSRATAKRQEQEYAEMFGGSPASGGEAHGVETAHTGV